MGHSPSTVKQTYYTAPRHTADSSIHSGNPFTADNSDRVGTADGPFLCNCAGSPATGLSLKGNAEILCRGPGCRRIGYVAKAQRLNWKTSSAPAYWRLAT